MISLVVGQKTTLTATLLDSLSHPVTGVDPGLINWSVDDDTVVAITPSQISSTSPRAPVPQVTGYSITVFAVGQGTTNVTATYQNQALTILNVTQFVVSPNASISISVAQGPVT